MLIADRLRRDTVAGYAFLAPGLVGVGAGGTAATPILEQVFLGRVGVPQGLRKAQDAGNEAMRG